MGQLAERTLQILKKKKSENEAEIILTTPIRELKKPLLIDSIILGEIIYLVANEEMAKEVEPEGKVAYTPEEIAALSRKSKTMDWQEWVGFLKMFHRTKKTFLGSRILA
jgi:hypothetical protein